MARQRRIKKAQYDKEVEEGVRSGRLLKLRAKYADSFDGTCVIDRCEKTAYAAYKCRRHYEMESGRSAFSRHYKLRGSEERRVGREGTWRGWGTWEVKEKRRAR